MKHLNIVESECFSLTKLRRKAENITITLPDGTTWDTTDYKELAKIKKTKNYDGKRVLKAYASPWVNGEYFIRCIG